MAETAPPLQQIDRTYVRWRTRRLSYFGGCDYLRLSSHPRLIAVVQRAAGNLGLNVAASRMTTGNHRIYETLETELGRFFGADTATLVSNGYLANLVVAQAMAGQFGLALIDERAHGSLRDAARMLGCPVRPFRHRDPADLARRSSGSTGSLPVVVLTDGLFSHDGSVAPLRRYRKKLTASAWLFIDDAHGGGVLGARGRGAPEEEQINRRRTIQTVTLSKAFGTYGGAILGSTTVRQLILERSRIFSGNTPLPLPLAMGALESIQLVASHRSWRERLHRNSQWIKARLREAGWPVPDFPGPIVSFIPGNTREAHRWQEALLKQGIHPPFIRYPGGPAQGYFRFAISHAHTREQLAALAEVWTRLRGKRKAENS